MSITALLWALLYCGSIVMSFVNPLFGSLGYLLEYYMRPELKWWGHDLPRLRYNLIISVVFGLTFLLRRRSLREIGPLPRVPLRWLVGLLALMAVVSSTVAVNRGISWQWVVQWSKVAMIFPLLLAGVIRTPGAFNLVVAANMLGASWWGYDAWTHPRRRAGRLISIGSGDSLNDNSAAAHLLAVLPLAVLYLLTEKDKRLRALALVATVLIINTLVLCNSRGASVALLAGVASAIFFVRTGYRMRLVGASIATVALVLGLADPQFLARQQTTTDYEQDGSAQQRLVTWQAGMRLVAAHPLGVGGRGFHLLSPQYIPEIVEEHDGELRAPHNTWVMVTSEWGILGLVGYLGLFLSVFGVLRRIKQQSRSGFFYWRALAIQVALVATLVAGTFTDRLYGEAPYWMVGLTLALRRVQLMEQPEAEPAPVRPIVPVAAVPAAVRS